MIDAFGKHEETGLSLTVLFAPVLPLPTHYTIIPGVQNP